MPAATTAFAVAVLGIDVCIAPMIEPGTYNDMKSSRSTVAGARVNPKLGHPSS
jgi:hypothetical protein